MKQKILFLLASVILLIACSSDNNSEPQLTEIPQSFQMYYNGKYKVFSNLRVIKSVYNKDQSNEYSALNIVTWQENESLTERMSLSINKWKNGRTIVNELWYVDPDDKTYIYSPSSNVDFKVEINPNTDVYEIKGTLYGIIYQNSGPSEIKITQGIFSFKY
ncbi:hypothetical protein [Flavobacterium sp. WC2509]|uniref:hypothetical protein n=1 Tax=Flavobacterium sp. WC2509 TaxID=3461406 RepID=UPI0040445706